MSVRCDKVMRRRKESVKASKGMVVPRWKCTKDCTNCICGIIRDKSGNEHHVNLMRGKKNAEIYDTIETDHEEKFESDHNEQGNWQTDDNTQQAVQAV